MIFVSLGTQDKSFKRLLDLIQKQIDLGNIKDKVIVQAGYTVFDSKDMKIFDYVGMDDFNKYVSDCDIFITHGGVGNILTALKKGKKIIAVPRLAKYKEHTNDHQMQIINSFYEKKYILKLDENDDFEDVLKKAKSFKPKTWVSNQDNFINKLRGYIEDGLIGRDLDEKNK